MRRLYYLADDIETASAISNCLHGEGISDWNFHVLSRDADGLYTHHIHSALPHHHKDLIRTGEIGAVFGGLIGLVLALAMLLQGPWFWLSDGVDVAVFTLCGAMLGALTGIRFGMQRDSHRLQPFHEDIMHGRYLIMVDVRKEDKHKIRELMNMAFPLVAYRGNDSTFVRPFKSNQRIFPRAVV